MWGTRVSTNSDSWPLLGGIAIVASLALSTSLTACGSGTKDSASGGGDGPVKIGFIVDQTGPLAPIGGGYARGVKSAVEAWNAMDGKRKVKVETCDSLSTGDGAIACYQRLRNSVDAISGPSLFVGLAAVRGIAAKGTVPLLSGAPLVDPPDGSPLFQTIPTVEDGIAASFAYFKKHDLARVAVLTSNDEPGNLAKAGVKNLTAKYGMSVVTEQVFDPTAQNLAPQAESIAAAKPDVVLAWTAGPQLITALRALKSANVDVPVMLNYASMAAPLLKSAGAEASSNLLFFASRAFDSATITDPEFKQRIEDFDRRYKAEFKTAPDLTAYDSADTIYVLGEAAKESTKPKAIRSALESGTEFPGLLFPTYKFSAKNHVGTSGAGVFDILRWVPDDLNWKLVK